jgi:xylulokinase
VWSRELCDLIGLNVDILPPIASAFSVAGTLTWQAAKDTGLLEGTPVAVGSGDSVVEAFGIGATEPGQCLVKLGTAANVNLVTDHAKPSTKTITYKHIIEPYWFSITAASCSRTFCLAR